MFTTLHRKLLCLLPVVLLALSLSLRAGEEKPCLILISFDGFRWDYANRGITPNLDKFKQNGVSALSLEPVFPSKTFPNHISIITGLYPENHGIILNTIHDPFSGREYRISDTNAVRDSRWYQGEFFWETAQRQGILCASYFWPGSEIVAPGREPAYRHFYEHRRPYEERIKGVLEWLNLPEEKRPRFITLYFHETDSKGHEYGPDSPEIHRAIALSDSLLGLLIAGLQQSGLWEQTNLIVVSDHGMSGLSPERMINVEALLAGFNCRYQEDGPFMFVEPADAEREAVYRRLQEGQNHFKVYWREEIPTHFHFSAHPFIPPIMVLAEPGWSLHTNRLSNWLERTLRAGGGNHGYDNHHLDMHGIFYAMGPAFKQGYRTGTIRNIDVYPLLCKIFNIMPRQNIDGRLERISFILKEN